MRTGPNLVAPYLNNRLELTRKWAHLGNQTSPPLCCLKERERGDKGTSLLQPLSLTSFRKTLSIAFNWFKYEKKSLVAYTLPKCTIILFLAFLLYPLPHLYRRESFCLQQSILQTKAPRFLAAWNPAFLLLPHHTTVIKLIAHAKKHTIFWNDQNVPE